MFRDASRPECTLPPSRRRWLLGTACLGAGALTGGALVAQHEENEPVAPPNSPEEALAQLYAGNRRFAQGAPRQHHRDLGRVKSVAPQQRPFAAFLGCADSRVPIEIVFDQGFGDLFVTRIAGNIASSENIGSLEFGTLVLGAQVLYVLGHTSCGAVAATQAGREVPGQISGLFQHIRPAIRQSGSDLTRAIADNVRYQCLVLSEASPVLARLVREKKLLVAGGVYDLATGTVSPVDLT
jgi:carbonic anhydrase